MTHKVNKAMGSDETPHWTHGLRRWENQCSLSSSRQCFTIYR